MFFIPLLSIAPLILLRLGPTLSEDGSESHGLMHVEIHVALVCAGTQRNAQKALCLWSVTRMPPASPWRRLTNDDEVVAVYKMSAAYRDWLDSLLVCHFLQSDFFSFLVLFTLYNYGWDFCKLCFNKDVALESNPDSETQMPKKKEEWFLEIIISPFIRSKYMIWAWNLDQQRYHGCRN